MFSETDDKTSVVTFSLLGHTYFFKTTLSKEEFNQLLDLLKDYVNRIKDENPKLPFERVMVLSLLLMADDILKLKEENESFKKVMIRLISKLQTLIEGNFEEG